MAHGLALLWDLDGTLADTAPDLAGALNHALAQADLAAVPPEHTRALVGGGAAAMLEAGLAYHGARVSAAVHEKLLVDFLEYYEQHIAEATTLYPDLETMLARAQKNDIAMAVVTNKREGLARQLLDALGLQKYFRVLVGGDSLAERKPHPLPLTHALEQMNCAPSSAIMIGDSDADLDAARAAQIPSVCVRFGYHPYFAKSGGGTPSSIEPRADALLTSYAELPATLARLNPRFVL